MRAKRNEELRHELDRAASEIDEGLLSFASPEAKHEWLAVRSRWWPASGAGADDGDLVVVVQKIRRFGAILQTLKVSALRRGS